MKGKMTVSHAKFQYYRHNYCLVFMTGMLGCRWHRYQQSTRDNRKRDIFWFSLFTLAFLYVTFYFYFWLIAENDYNYLEWYMFKTLKTWVPWYKILMPLTCATFGYFLLVMVLYLCHIGHGHQIYIHPVHLVLIILSLAACAAVTIIIDDLWHMEFHVIYLSLQMMGPFLHIGAVSLMTCMMWLISHSWYKLSRKLYQLLWLLVIVVAMVGLYVCPLYIQCPCVSSSHSMPLKPGLFAHRGAEGIAPENTNISFQKAVENGAFGLESDVRISYDGVPFINHDDTFQRTTNVDDIFPDRAGDDVSTFNISDIEKLDAGSWFLETDPFSTASDVSDADRDKYKKQKVFLLEDLLQLAAKHDVVVMFDVRNPVESNPFRNRTMELVIQTLLNSTFNLTKLYWIIKPTDSTDPVVAPPRAPKIYGGAPSVDMLEKENITKINARFDYLNEDLIWEYKRQNISTNVYVIDSSWFFSYYWCLGATSITTRRIDQLSQLENPNWTLASSSYLIMWVSVDVLSAVIIMVIFVVQRIRLFGTSFSPESISLTSARHARTYRSRTMKEKLLREGITDPTDDTDSQGSGVINHPAAYSMSSLPPSSFSTPSGAFPTGHSNVRVGPITQPDHKYEME
ncbi:glycerophosphodiester phosphodiesterase domain-containing protein 5-like isoform X2 [Littorina saxatilis]